MSIFGHVIGRSTLYALLAALAFGCGWKVNGWRLGEGIAQQQTETIRMVRVEERRQQDVADTEGEKGHDQIEAARAAADRARSDADRLRDEARRLATGLAVCNAETAGQRQARIEAANLHSDVFDSVVQRSQELAEEADKSYAAGATCERIYDGVSGR